MTRWLAGVWTILMIVAAPAPAADETPRQWFADGRAAVEAARRVQPNTGRARNVILFIGDGMGVTTVTAARILEGQSRGRPGEENLLAFETLPYTALVKTYNTDLQTPDSAGTMTAIVTGAKTRAGLVSVDQTVATGDAAAARDHTLATILEQAERRGLATGVVTTTRLTHATPACCYAHAPDREWECDADLPAAARHAGFADIARQLIEFPFGDGLEVALGGGRRAFLPAGTADPEDAGASGRRIDGRDLTAEWSARPGAAYVWNQAQFDAVDATSVTHLLGLFDPSHMKYEFDRPGDAGGEPSLSAMTVNAIEVLRRNPNGFLLMVEGGRIDHAHHAGNAFRALHDCIEFARAVAAARKLVDPDETLIIVTADHSHVFSMGGYPARGNPILGLVRGVDDHGRPNPQPARDALGLPYTTLAYANGPGYIGASASQPEGPKQYPHLGLGFTHPTQGRADLFSADTTAPCYLQECAVPLASETHGGEDVPLYAAGPWAHLFRGVMEQNVIYHVIVAALGWDEEVNSQGVK